MSAARREAYLWLASRASAAVLALCVVVHLATMIVAVRSGLSAADILGRTRGSTTWAVFYAVFVIAVAVHAPLGLRSVLSELVRRQGALLDWTMALLALVLLAGGLRAVFAVTIA
ncbi:MAG TPA: succinate dehydrogenase [Casimicrobiaceae bacterium]|nr:succinate dehydrogenase [Casimicrobiaceae bacterium]